MEPPKMIATEEEMKAARIPPAWRDVCAHVLIKLNECRRDNYYRMNKCQELRHEYEKCQYEDHKRREAEYQKQHEEKQ
ncbi:NADH-ubiquinone oxidoreductase b18 [Blastocystis sp. ATCC 50177/Nand II]|uniref:NADH dehydrogenase [ubiquinone] 1 beta subcomplex subunit 7 n=1 Tax=Blastocystis sp. subtype 1 (strain ATCC 50177 / NandII) TaxID=478820 RepID=A0A196SLH0_BLAHN|nr:NADH-ubiquinone oxidoreductase b18 [Blastocystis sp. ATCC 50177/Nand II]